VFLLLDGQMAYVFGRKPTMLANVFLFVVRSSIYRVAQFIAMLPVGRVILGIRWKRNTCDGRADMVAIEERPKYPAILLAVSALETVIGSPLGGAITTHRDGSSI
jgi:predicted MFS family arabinose efflux permease